MRALFNSLHRLIGNLSGTSEQSDGDSAHCRARFDLREQVRARHFLVEEPIGGELLYDLLVATLR